MKQNFGISWADLSPVKRYEILELFISSLKSAAENEGEKFLKREWNDPKPQSWEEAYIRTYATDCKMWASYEKGDETQEELGHYYWIDTLDDHFIGIAEKSCYQSMKHLEITVEV